MNQDYTPITLDAAIGQYYRIPLIIQLIRGEPK